MARQRLGPKKTARLREKLALPIAGVLVRGGTGHRQDLLLEDGSVVHYWPRTGEQHKSDARWRMPEGES